MDMVACADVEGGRRGVAAEERTYIIIATIMRTFQMAMNILK
jgi:hypothetical protein